MVEMKGLNKLFRKSMTVGKSFDNRRFLSSILSDFLFISLYLPYENEVMDDFF